MHRWINPNSHHYKAIKESNDQAIENGVLLPFREDQSYIIYLKGSWSFVFRVPLYTASKLKRYLKKIKPCHKQIKTYMANRGH